MRTITLISLVALLTTPNFVFAEVTFDWAPVGNPGNVDDQPFLSGAFGSVDYFYRISKHEVTTDQFAEFLNKVAASDPNNIYIPQKPGGGGMDIIRNGSDGSYTYTVAPGFGSKPIDGVSIVDAMRFVNWLENGQPTGSQTAGVTETGVYSSSAGRAADAKFFIPTEDEWYKAAFYDPRSTANGGPPGDDNYWAYPTQHDTQPIAEDPPGGPNSGNFSQPTTRGGTTEVGAYTEAMSFYGAFDMAGNLWDLTECGAVRGGEWPEHASSSESGAASVCISPAPRLKIDDSAFGVGFRVAAIPEPSSQMLALFASLGLLLRRKRSSLVAG